MHYIKLVLLDMVLEGLPPTVNQMYRTSKTRIRYKTKKARDFQRDAVKAMQAAHLVPYTFKGRVSLNVKFYVSDKRKWDLDNRLKALQDCLQMAKIIEDDSQIDSLHVEREKSSGDESRTCVKVISLIEGQDRG